MVPAYPASPTVVTPVRRCILMLAHYFDRNYEEETVLDVANAYGVSRAWLYQLADRAKAALAPRVPGPGPGAHAVERLESIVTPSRP